ncbi:hypothetical protein KZZ08_12155 [Roseovarius mucosus]|uniref:hypothetical protein n=1 Tax=Roseovarius mucosus TaxID=215743 RepID=UPI001C603AFA|nr:hypothetical protein [Roseovarius mucosus]MBW4974377.1 hypothetical protein [Roseovarius mucosus]
MRAGVLLVVLICAAFSLGAQEAPVVASPQECDTCQARHRALQSLQSAGVGAGRQEEANTTQPAAADSTGAEPQAVTPAKP